MERGEFRVVGRRLPRVDGIEKVTGKTVFGADVKLPRLLSGKILRSPYPHARILKIGTSKAKKISGVKAIITAEDTPKRKFCFYKLTVDPALADKLILEDEKVRFVGDEVAAVAAETVEIAEEAIDLIEVEYEELPPVFDPEEAMKASAPLVHDGVERNVSRHLSFGTGDVEKGLQEADYIFEDRFATQQVDQCVEPQCCVASYDHPTGRLTIWTPTQMPFLLRVDLADVLNLSEGKIRIIRTAMGSGFGEKMEMHPLVPICALLSMKTGRPVQIVHSREEQFIATRTRHPVISLLKTGVKRDGTIVASQFKAITDNGAYNAQSFFMTFAIGGFSSAVYSRIPHFSFDADIVYTNKPYGSAFRGYGNPQGSFAREVQMDVIAEKLGMDPMELRLRNASRSGDVSPLGWKITSCGLTECIKKAARAIGWEEKRRQKVPYRGVGMACAIHVGGGAARFVHNTDGCGAFIKVEDDGTVTVMTGAAEVGGGQATVCAMIAAEVLGVHLEDVRVENTDTDIIPWDLGTHGSRSTFCGGNAVRVAAEDAKQQLLRVAAEKLEADIGDLEVGDRKIYVKGVPQKALTIPEAVRAGHYCRGSELVLGKGWYDPPNELADAEGKGNLSAAYTFICHVAEVEVDKKTGKVKVLRFVAAQDVGRAINPLGVEGQMEGGAGIGIGYALYEGYRYDETGQLINRTFMDYKIPTTAEIPLIKTIIVETTDSEGPFGAKGIGEGCLNPTAPAIANAIYDAIGVRFKELPITPEKILRALKDRDEAR